MPHPPRALLDRLALLLEPPEIQCVNDTLLSAALAPGARQLTPLIQLVDRNVAEKFEQVFTDRSALGQRDTIVAVLRELAAHERTHDDVCHCRELGASIAPFARNLMRSGDPFYRGLGAIILRDVVLELALSPPSQGGVDSWSRSSHAPAVDPRGMP